MHIGIDARFVQGPNTGVTNYLINLLKGLSRVDQNNSYSVFLSNPSYNGRTPEAKNFRTEVNTANAFIWKNVWLPQQVRRLKIDIMHFPAYTGSFAYIKNNVVTIHDLIHKVNPRWFSRKELLLMELPIRLAIKRAAKIIAVSENTKKDIMKYYKVEDKRIAVTLEAADTSFRPISDLSTLDYIKKKYALDADFILYVGVLFKRRNIPRLLEAFALLRQDKNIKHKLVIAGPGRDYFNLTEHINKHNLKDKVIYLDYVQQEDMSLLYNAATFFVYPSLYEGFGLPVLEAMSCGKAVITSCVSSLPEVAGNAALLIDPNNTEELCDAMYRLIKDSALRQNLGRIALERSKIFSWDRMAEGTIKIYRDVMNMDRKNTVATDTKTEISKKHFFNEGERIKVKDKQAIYEIRDPKDLALQVDFGFARYDIILRIIDKYCREKNMSHLDLGCGLGYLMAKMSQKGFKTSGTDISKSFLDIAEEKLRHWHLSYEKLLEADLQKYIDLPNKSYDIITATDVLEHIDRPRAFLEQCNRLLSGEGRIFICTNNILSIWGLEKLIKEKFLFKKGFHPIDRWFSFFSLKRLIGKSGFKIVEVRGTYFLPLSRLRWLLKLCGIFQRGYEINEYLSTSPLKYFGRDIILVLEKKGVRNIKIRSGGSISILPRLSSFFWDPFTKVKRNHTPLRLLNLLLVRLQLLFRTSKVIGYPSFLVLEPTNMCNLKCPLCPTGQGLEGRSKGKMTFGNFKKIIDELGSYLYSLRLENWGEPLMNEEIFDMTSYAKTKKIAISFNTNLSILDDDSAKELILSGLDHVKISLDGTTEESYAKYRIGGDFKTVINNIKLLVRKRAELKKRNPYIEIQFIVMRHNEEDISRIKQLSAELGVDGLMIEKLRPDMRQELFDSTSISVEKFKDWLPYKSEFSLFDYRNKTRKDIPKICSYLWTTIVINWDGSLVPCCSVYDECYNFGNIFKDGFKKIWNGPKYIASRRLIGRRLKITEDVVCINCFKHGIIN